jgi:type I restriction enzyme S subunit
MKSNYKLLGDFITRVDVRNRKLQTTNLKGLSMKKEFRESTSNIVGVDLSKYKLVPKNHFACDFMSVIRVHKLPVVHQNSDDLIIVSPAYTVFKVIDENILNPEYLMMWFRRPEFDRYADFRCDSAIRGGFKWEELGEVELPIPSIEKQREIVKEYNTIIKRIKLNETLNQKLEDTAQALYKHWFVDFEFPNADGKSYKTSGGEMVWNEELDMAVPLGWIVNDLEELIEYRKGNPFKSDDYIENGNPIVRVSDLTQKSIDFRECLFVSNVIASLNSEHILLSNDIIITSVGSWPYNPLSVVGKVVKVPNVNEEPLLNQNMVRIRTIDKKLQLLLFTILSRKEFSEYVISGAQGSANQASVTLKHLFAYNICLPNEENLIKICDAIDKIYNMSSLKNKESFLLQKALGIIHSKMSKS